MIKHSRHGVIEEVSIMIKTGASENIVSNYIESLYKKEEITTKIYELLLGMIIDNY